MNRLLACLSLAVTIAFAGCQSMQSVKLPEISAPSFLTGNKAKDEPQTPSRMAIIWKDANLADVGKPTTRGFGGRIYFYDENNDPIRAQGELVVFGYDESNSDASSNADRKYVFDETKFQSHYSETELGPSYSVWIPWDPAGGMRKSVALVPVFKDQSGRVVQGGQSINVLPGKAPPEDTVAKVNDLNVIRISEPYDRSGSEYLQSQANRMQQNGYGNQQVSHTAKDASRHLRTTTIRVPHEMGRQIQSANRTTSRFQTSQSNDSPANSPLMARLAEQNSNSGYNVRLGNSESNSNPAAGAAQAASATDSNGRQVSSSMIERLAEHNASSGYNVRLGNTRVNSSPAAESAPAETETVEAPLTRFRAGTRASQFGQPGSFR